MSRTPLKASFLNFLKVQITNIVSVAYWSFTPYLNPGVDFSNETIVITGGNVGLGLHSAIHCLKRGASRVIITTRDGKKGEAAAAQIRQATTGSSKGSVEVWDLDLTKRVSIEAFAKRCAAELPRFDRFLCNAGLATMNFTTVNGIETTVATSVHGTFLLLLLLMPQLRVCGRVSGRPATVTIVSSDLHRNTKFREQNNKDILASLNDKKTARMLDRYNVVKLMQIMLTLRLASALCQERLSSERKIPEVTINCCSPGLVDTSLQRSFGILGPVLKFIAHAYTPKVGSCDLVNALAAGPESHGKYMIYCEYAPVSEIVSSAEGKLKAQQIWSELSKQLNVSENSM